MWSCSSFCGPPVIEDNFPDLIPWDGLPKKCKAYYITQEHDTISVVGTTDSQFLISQLKDGVGCIRSYP